MKKVLVLLLTIACCLGFARASIPVAETTPLTQSVFAAENRGALLQLIETLLHIPYVVTVDSQNPTMHKVTAVLAGLGTHGRLGYQLLANRQNTTALKVLFGTAPKVLGYMLAAYYDVIRYIQADQLAEGNKNPDPKLHAFKLNQAALLALEIVIRLLVVAAQVQGIDSASWVTWGLSELSDYLGLWRLVSRYISIVLTLERLELELTVQQKPQGQAGAGTTKGIETTQTLEQELAAFTQALPKDMDTIAHETH